MSDLTLSFDEDKPRELCPTGLVPAVCIWVEDLGHHENTYQGKTSTRREVIFGFELDKRFKDAELAGDMFNQRFHLSMQMTASFHDKANLPKMLRNWRGHDFTQDEIQKGGFRVSEMVGVGAMVNVIRKTSLKGREYVKIGDVMGLPEGQPPIIAEVTDVPDWVREKQKVGGVDPFNMGDTSPDKPLDEEAPF